MADSKRESREVGFGKYTMEDAAESMEALGKVGEGCGNDTCYCIEGCLGFDREEIVFRKRADSAHKAFENNEVKTDEDDDKPSDISIKVTADVNEAITGFKALQRELRETTKAVRELEQAYSSAAEAYKDAEKASKRLK